MKRWITRDDEGGPAGGSARPLSGSVAPPLARVLAARGVATPADLDRFLNPRLSDVSDPFGLHDMQPAVERLWRALRGGESIAVFGDYDVDGVTSAALMIQVLTRLGGRVSWVLPNRIEEGYGLGVDGVRRCIEAARPGLIVTTDCGTGSCEAVAAAAAAGVDVVVTDHHEIAGAVAPAVAVVNPKLGADPGCRMLAGVGVAFKTCHALLKHGRQHRYKVAHEVDLREYLDLVALGTIADVVPLLHENRVLARHGLARLNERGRLGVNALAEAAGAQGELGAYHVGFVLGPRLNAVGRLGNAEQALELLLTDHPPRARSLADILEATNRERKRIETEILDAAIARIESAFDPDSHFGLVAGETGWHVGVVGIVAARLAQRYGRPAIVIGFDESGHGRGSCRGIEGFDLLRGLRHCEPLLLGYGGHDKAAGLELRRDNLEAFREAFLAACSDGLKGRDLRPALELDGWVTMHEALDRDFLAMLRRMAPFGEGNREPVWGLRGARVIGRSRVVGGKHLKFTVGVGDRQCEAIGFNMAERPVPDGPLDIAFTLREDTYQGRATPQFHLKDFREHEA